MLDEGFAVGFHVNSLYETVIEMLDGPIVVNIHNTASMGIDYLMLSPVGYFTHIVLYMKKISIPFPL